MSVCVRVCVCECGGGQERVEDLVSNTGFEMTGIFKWKCVLSD